jgi:hypothetical protein
MSRRLNILTSEHMNVRASELFDGEPQTDGSPKNTLGHLDIWTSGRSGTREVGSGGIAA